MAGMHGRGRAPRTRMAAAVFSSAAARRAPVGFPNREGPFAWSLGGRVVRLAWELAQKYGKGSRPRVTLTCGPGHVSHSPGDATGLIRVHRLNEFAPGTDSAPGDDVIDGGLGELAAGNLGEMPMRHQGFVEFQWPGFEHEIHGGTEPRHPFQSEFGQLTGLEGRQG